MNKQIKLTIKDIRDNFYKNAINRGRVYASQGKVLEYEVSFDSDKKIVDISSTVLGRKKYYQDIRISDFEDVYIEDSCSCPMRTECKHTVAVLYKMIEDGFVLRDLSPEGLEAQWLDSFTSVLTKEHIPIEEKKAEFLLYRLFEESNDDINLYKGKILKNGTLSKGASLSKERILFYSNAQYQYPYLTDEDSEILEMLRKITDNGYGNYSKFKGEYGTIVLKKLLQTGRCFFQKNSTPLFFSETALTLSFSWEEGQSHSRLVSNLKEEEYLCSRTSPLLVINRLNNEVYEAKSTQSPQALNFLLKAPPLPNENLVSLTGKILERFPDIDFPLPSTFEMEELRVEPRPYVYVHGKIIDNRTKHFLELSFVYDHHKVESHKEGAFFMVQEKRKNIKVYRDRVLEARYVKVIEELGFEFYHYGLTPAYLSMAKPNMQVAIERWRDFSENQVEKLRAKGWNIEIADNFNYSFEYIESISIESVDGGDVNPWFELSFSVDIGGRTLSLLPIVASLLQEFDSVEELPEKLNLEIEEGKYLHINAKDIRPIMQTVFELFDKQDGDKLIVNAFDAHLLDFDSDADIIWKGAKALKELSEKLKNFKGIEQIEPSKNLNAELRDYQSFGLDWLNFLHEFSFGGILADDMGLGKTIQTLAFLQVLKERGELSKPSLIVMPTSLIGNWKNEIKKFTPELTFLELYGIDRASKFHEMENYDVILTTYQLAQRDEEKYEKKKFCYLILDEAQKIKNPKAKMSVAIKNFKSEHKLALSGTPIENHLGELWSIFDFLMNGFLDNLTTFRNLYQTPIEQDHDFKRRALLNKKIAPFILRRTKEEVVLELPAKTEIVKRATFSPKQAKLYENIRVTMEKKVREAIKGKGLSRSHITILDALLKLRQVCCDPSLLKLDAAKKVKDSAKLEMFLELIDTLMSEGKKVLVFSQFTSMLSIIETAIKKRKINYTKLTGSTRRREEAIEKFTKGEADIFLISLKAGGVGLNLVEADTVIHYDPWWNPAVENQATDRAYRIGQDKAVFVYKLIVENTIEEQILKLQEKKKALQAGIYKGTEEQSDKFDGEELVSLLRL